MEGAWRTYPSGRRWNGGPDHEIRAVLSTAATDAVGYRLPVVELLPTADEDDVVGHLGPDLLGPDWDPTRPVAGSERSPDSSIGEALLDQRNLAGLGTFYRAELLFLQGLHPRTPVSQVTTLARVVQRAHLLLNANKVRAEQSTTGDLRQGRPRVRVRTPRSTLSALRHLHPYGGVRSARPGTAQLLVPALPAGAVRRLRRPT